MSSEPGLNVMQQNATESLPSTSVVLVEEEETQEPVPHGEGAVRLILRKPKSDKIVKWKEGTVDNENMNKKKSKCCCVYKKPHVFGESSSSDSETECEHCSGHVEKKKPNNPPEAPAPGNS